MGLSWERVGQTVRPFVPFTALNTVWRHLDGDALTVLDVGCGRGRPMAFLRARRRISAVGADVFEPYLRECQRRQSHDALIRCDVRFLPFRPKSFDAVLCLEVLEHMGEEEGRALMRAMEELARRQVIITTPLGRHDQHEFDENPWQEHRHIWEPRELRALGYRIYGHGVRNLGGLSGVQSPLPRPLRPLMDFLWVAAGPFVHFRPEWAGNAVCIRRLGKGLSTDGS